MIRKRGMFEKVSLIIGGTIIVIAVLGVGTWVIALIYMYGVAYPIFWINMKISTIVRPFFEMIPPKKLGGLIGILFSWLLTAIVILFPIFLMGVVEKWRSRKK